MTASCICFSIKSLCVELLDYGYSVQFFLSSDAIEVFECGGESWTEGFT